MRTQPFASLLLAALCALPSGAGAADQKRLAVLEFELAPGVTIDRTYFSDLARAAAHRRVPHLLVMTRESTEVLLGSSGKQLVDCAGECEIEVGRKLGADFIASGRAAQIGSWLILTMRLFDTANGQLLESAEARGKSADELLEKADTAVALLFDRLASHLGAPAPAEPVKPAAVEAARPAPVEPAKPSPVDAARPASVEPAKPAPAEAASPAGEGPTKPAPAVAARTAPAAALAPEVARAPSAQAPARSRTLAWLCLGSGALVAGGSVAFDNLSSTSKDGKLRAVDFLPVAGYALAIALGAFGTYALVTP